MIYLKLLFIYHILITINALVVEDLLLFFEKQACIEASLISLSQNQDAGVIIDKNSHKQIPSLINITEITKTRFEKSVTSKINELAQYNEIEYTYELVSEEGPAHKKVYNVILKLGDEEFESSGPSLKKAKNAAAMFALENTYYKHPPISLEPEEVQPLTPTVMLNNIGMKLGIHVSYLLITDEDEKALSSYGPGDEAYGKSKSYFSKLNSSTSFRVPTEEAQISGPFTVRVRVGDSSFIGTGHTVQAARHDAASNAIKSMQKEMLFKDNVCNQEESVEQCRVKRESLKSPISRVYETAQIQNVPVEFNLIKETGKSHQKHFVTQCKLGDFVTEGEGKSKKESKKVAAEKMLENFSYLLDVVDEREIINGLKNKKKKKKIKKLTKNNSGNVGKAISAMLTSFWSANDQQSIENNNVKRTNKMEGNQGRKRSKETISSKDSLLEFSNALQIQVQFSDLNDYKGHFYTLMSLDVHPLHICLGKAFTRDESHDDAALHGLKFLHKIGILNKTKFSEKNEQSFYINEDYWEDYKLSLSVKDSEK